MYWPHTLTDSVYPHLPVQAASKQLARPDFIILTGDYVRHDSDLLPNPVQDVLHIFRNITDLLVTTFPSVPRIHLPPAVLGNNDFDSDYDLPNVTEGITLYVHREARVWRGLQ